jgi:hypothetical protein
LGWLITWVLLALLGGLAVFTRRGRHRQPADETLIAELLGPSKPSAVRVLPAPQPREEAEPAPAPQPREESEPAPAPAVPPAGEGGGWLETQLALITAWSERMEKQIASSPADPDPWRCIAITTKGSQCKLPAAHGDTKCGIHGGRAHLSARARAPGGHLHDDSCHEGPRLVVAGLLRSPAGPTQGIVGRWAVSSWIMRAGTGYLPPLRHVQPAIRRRS